MGQDIATSQFSESDFDQFMEHLRVETGLLREWFSQAAFADVHEVGGFEVEAWLVDNGARPAPFNEQFLAALDNPNVVPELSKFNVELNTPERTLTSDALGRMQADLEATWRRCEDVGANMDVKPAMIGILPSVHADDMTLKNMSDRERYRALNEQVLRLRRGHPLILDIQGRDRLQMQHHDVMLEAATTSFQIHVQVNKSNAVRLYNAAQILSAPMVAVTANSPFAFGRDLWDETRVPLFEQSVNTCYESDVLRCPPARVTLGHGYIRTSLMELFAENLEHFPVLLPHLFATPVEDMSHVRLHNGTIWRWNRPLVGFGNDGTPHLRIEHRTVPAGPSVPDTIANAALFFGLARAMCDRDTAPESELKFEDARHNFYAAARHGLSAELKWFNGWVGSAQVLLLENLLPLARSGLAALGIDPAEIAAYLEIIEARVRSGQNGARWQRDYHARHGCTMAELTSVYLEHQQLGKPVHEWMI